MSVPKECPTCHHSLDDKIGMTSRVDEVFSVKRSKQNEIEDFDIIDTINSEFDNYFCPECGSTIELPNNQEMIRNHKMVKDVVEKIEALTKPRGPVKPTDELKSIITKLIEKVKEYR